MFSTISRLPALLFCIYTKLLLKRKKVQCPLYYRRKPSLNFSVTMITFLCEEKSHGFKMRVWIIVHSKLAKNNYFFDVWCRNVQMISRTKTSPPTLLRKCALENLKKEEWKKKIISVRLIVCLNDMMNVAIVHKSREMVCVFTKKRKEIRTRLVNIHYIYLYGICKAHTYKHYWSLLTRKKDLSFCDS